MVSKHKVSNGLSVFLCHGSENKDIVREIYSRLLSDGFSPWFDEKNIIPGQDWDTEIRSAVKNCHAILVCLSSTSIGREGYVQKEIKFALDVADEKTDQSIFLIPVRLDNCKVPQRLCRWQWVNYFDKDGYEKIVKALTVRADECGIDLGLSKVTNEPISIHGGDAISTTFGAELNNYLDEYNKAQSSGDVDKQFHWLSEIINSLHREGKVDEVTHFAHIMLDLARKTDRLDQEMLAMISLKNLYHYVIKNDQEALRWAEKIHDIGVQINAIKDTENIRFLVPKGMLYGKEALRLINGFLSSNEDTLRELRMYGR